MTKNGIVLTVVAVLLAAVYAFFFTDWFIKPTIQIIPTIRPGRASAIPRNDDSEPVCPVSFSFDGKYKLTAIKVVNAGEFATNKYATPLWHMISDSNSLPTKSIVYGFKVPGMKPAVPRAKPEPLDPDTPYVLLVEAGNVKSQTNFHTSKLIPLGRPQ